MPSTAIKPLFFATPKLWRAWLEQNHANATEIVVGFYKTITGKPTITWPESVEEALCFGWIDGGRKGISAEAYCIRFTPRKPTSIWSAINVAKVAALKKAGRMRPAGDAAFAKRIDDKTGVYSFEQAQAAELTPAHAKRLAANAKAKAFFGRQAAWYQRAAMHWVASAKQDETRERRFETLLECSADGRTVPPLTPRAPEYVRDIESKPIKVAPKRRTTREMKPLTKPVAKPLAKPAKPRR